MQFLDVEHPLLLKDDGHLLLYARDAKNSSRGSGLGTN